MSELQFEHGNFFNDAYDSEKIHHQPHRGPSGHQPTQPHFGFIPMPVDFETYQKWLSSFGENQENFSGHSAIV